MDNKIENGVRYGFLDSEAVALENYKPRLLINDPSRHQKVIQSLKNELSNCDEFKFSVAFITQGGVELLLTELQSLENKNIKGTIIASQYQNFTEPKALDKLLSFKNIELWIVNEEAKMHTKGYIFRRGEEYSLIVGSSNMTSGALTENKEWNIKLSSSNQGHVVQEFLQEFDSLKKISTKVTKDWIKQYNKIYKEKRLYNSSFVSTTKESQEVYPNEMQVKALDSLEQTRALGANKALIVSATGTGKTYLSAFDVKKCNPKKFLFIVHREKIAKDAMKSYQRVLGKDKKMALFGGGHKDIEGADYVFSMIQTLTNDNALYQFGQKEFDYIVIDEVHRAGAKSYQKVFNYFKPKFYLGMSATPERTDGFNVYEMFDYNVPYEIRLQDAIEGNLICPFHYFGVSELTVDGKTLDDESDFSLLTSEERVKHILNKIAFYGYYGERVKGLVFCSRNEEAAALSEQFNKLGYRTVALSGADSEEKREAAIQRLEQEDNNESALDYIFTVDIFNEGVDIPCVNQVVMLRPTQSAIVFVQQLGRGLRKFSNKEYVVVIDFIANYKQNYLIPVALSGDNTLRKDNIRRYVSQGASLIPGISSVDFEEVVKERIYEAIDNVDFSKKSLIFDSYKQLKNKLGHIPSLMEFEQHKAIDIARIFEAYDSYYAFLKAKEKGYSINLNSEEEQFINYISSKFAIGKRPHELEFLSILLDGSEDLVGDFKSIMKKKYPSIKVTNNTVDCVINQFLQQYLPATTAVKYKKAIFIEKNGSKYIRSKLLSSLLNNKVFRDMVLELIEVGLYRNETYFSDRYKNTSFALYQKYTYEDVCRGLDWQKSEVALNIGGYKYDSATQTYPIFINYNKDEDISGTIKYEDRFISESQLIAISKNKRTLQSNDVQSALHSKELGISMELFVRKNKDDSSNSKEFYYLGRLNPTGNAQELKMKTADETIVEIEYDLETPVKQDIYNYIVG